MRRIETLSLRLLFATALFACPARASAAPPHIFWASDPVRPDETVLLQGSDLGGPAAVVEAARLDDPNPSALAGKSAQPAANLAAPSVKQWTKLPAIQPGEQSLKFVIPRDWPTGVYACRVTAAGVTTDPVLLNAPDPWWAQGDEGEAATPGGWLRVLGKSLTIDKGHTIVRLEPDPANPAGTQPAPAEPVTLQPAAADPYSLRFDLPRDLKAGSYTVRVHNGFGGEAAWRSAGTIRIEPAPAIPSATYSVLETYGPDAVAKMRQTLVKYSQPADRTDGILAALKKAKENGGGVVYFPAGRYTVKGALSIPEHTILRGEGTGLVTLWWGTGHFNLDGGGPQGRAKVDEPKPPQTLIYGPDYSIEDMSLYLPLDYEQGLSADKRFRMNRVRVRIDHYWLVQGRGNGTVARLGRNFQVSDCDILAKGDALVPGGFGLIAHNQVRANKSNTPMGGSRNVIVEDNSFVSMDPTAYQNIAGSGRNIYYARNHQESLYAQQADYSFTFDAGGGAYLGGIAVGGIAVGGSADANGTQVTLAGDPTYPKWAPEKSELWRRSAVFLLDGRGAGQWRDVVGNHGRRWEIDRPFDTPPDATTVASIVPFNGRVLIVDNRFEDANWVNAGYGTSIDVVCAGNKLLRCADLINYGVRAEDWCEPSWHVQYFDNLITEGQTHVGSSSGGHKADRYAGPLTCCAVHRRHTIAADNSGSITLTGNLRDAIVEGCTLKHPLSTIKVDGEASGVLFRENTFEGTPSPRYEGSGAKAAAGAGD